MEMRNSDHAERSPEKEQKIEVRAVHDYQTYPYDETRDEKYFAVEVYDSEEEQGTYWLAICDSINEAEELANKVKAKIDEYGPDWKRIAKELEIKNPCDWLKEELKK